MPAVTGDECPRSLYSTLAVCNERHDLNDSCCPGEKVSDLPWPVELHRYDVPLEVVRLVSPPLASFRLYHQSADAVMSQLIDHYSEAR